MFYNENIFKRLAEISQRTHAYPPFNIKKTDKNNYVIEMALAGFTKSDIHICMEGGELKITGKTQPDDGEYLYKGIANRFFEKSFILNDSIKLKNAYWSNGMLRVILESLLPEKHVVDIEDEPEDFNSVR